jgi:hypothetical protein
LRLKLSIGFLSFNGFFRGLDRNLSIHSSISSVFCSAASINLSCIDGVGTFFFGSSFLADSFFPSDANPSSQLFKCSFLSSGTISELPLLMSHAVVA